MKDLEVKEIFEKVSEGVSGITSVVINLVALAILVEVIYGQGISEWALLATSPNSLMTSVQADLLV